MNVPKIRFGDWVKHEEGFTPVDKILCAEILPQGDTNHPRTKDEDAFYVEVTLTWLDLWLPDKHSWELGAGVLQMSDYQKFEVYRGTKVECTAVLSQIIGEEIDDNFDDETNEV